MEAVILNTKRLMLRPITPDDLEDVYSYVSDIENTRLMMNLPVDSIEETAEWLGGCDREWQKETPGICDFAVMLDGALIGDVFVEQTGIDGCGELCWCLDKKYWGNGYATEAARIVIQFARERLHIKHFIAHCDSENIASCRVMEKLGMHRVSVESGRKNRSSREPRMECLYEL